MLNLVRRYMWIVPVILGIVFIAAGAFMISEGQAAKNDVRTELMAEEITTSKDASIPEVAVTDADTARSQADAIRIHTLNATGGLTYAELPRTDPNRTTYLNGVSLRTALNLAVMGLKVSDLVMGVGAFIVVIGVSNVLVFAPALFWIGAAAPAGVSARRAGVPARLEPQAGG